MGATVAIDGALVVLQELEATHGAALARWSEIERHLAGSPHERPVLAGELAQLGNELDRLSCELCAARVRLRLLDRYARAESPSARGPARFALDAFDKAWSAWREAIGSVGPGPERDALTCRGVEP